MGLMEKLSLKGRTGIVTGGGQGLGRAFCQGFAEMGANVVVAEINEETGNRAAAELSALGGKSVFVRTDATKRKDLDSAVKAALAIDGRVDFMMNNAGVTDWKEAENMSEGDWRKLMAINLDAVLYGCQAVFEVMKKQGKGSIINTASMSGHIVNIPQCQAGYNVSKAAVMHLTKSLAVEWAQYGIRVNSISPGYMNGPMAGKFFDDPKIGPVWRGMTPMRRPGEPEELAGAATLLASDASSFTTGSDYVVDGGFTCV
ncbi:MAG: glucose 1-dehydrogenase [Planctomycetota bacterium]|jgi:NAD(P)-dependent dehydrogenase (short-subunit alcohol dehydrogenase family)|nr:glucose 1-dehydrogenase [Planctomycetota bacterium]